MKTGLTHTMLIMSCTAIGKCRKCLILPPPFHLSKNQQLTHLQCSFLQKRRLKLVVAI